ncbi:DUF541 domain-containing protein [Lysinibacillus telephonicus]|uniref:DUF541 domain-containing protein n=1 Tax=Lysinibacillus telephonicus TaxID=1714840 RepID=A0A3S0HPQ9_9BACI|nr:DUF541 domain-containing protein [Lysinibacillus telephonicus]
MSGRWNQLVNSNVFQQTVRQARTITVIGNGQIEVQPNFAEVQIEVSTEADEVTEAQRENAVKMNQVIQSLLALNIPREDIQTAFYNVFPSYDYIEGRQVFRGYEVTNSLTVKIRNINEVGLVIDTALRSGANRISQLEFKLDNEEIYQNQALQLAFQNANSKVQAIAVSLQLPYMPQPIEIVEESAGRPILYRTVAMTEQAVRTPIEPGIITIDAAIRVKYQY